MSIETFTAVHGTFNPTRITGSGLVSAQRVPLPVVLTIRVTRMFTKRQARDVMMRSALWLGGCLLLPAVCAATSTGDELLQMDLTQADF